VSAPEKKDPTRGPGYETRDIRIRPILYSALLLVLLALGSQLGMLVLFRDYQAKDKLLNASQRPLAAELRREEPPEPRLQTHPLADLAALHAWEDRIMTTYAWVDRSAGTVRIPVDRAKDMIVERGLPVRREGR
jgi:hypothetical protein